MKCTHIKTDGIRCGSPALRGEQFCYFHYHNADHRPRRKTRVVNVPLPEDAAAVQVGIYNVMLAIIDRRIDERRAQQLLWALQIASSQTEKLPFENSFRQKQAVTELPHYEVEQLDTDAEQQDAQPASQESPNAEDEEQAQAATEQEPVAEEDASHDPDEGDDTQEADATEEPAFTPVRADAVPDLRVDQVNELMEKISSGEPGAANRLVRQLCG